MIAMDYNPLHRIRIHEFTLIITKKMNQAMSEGKAKFFLTAKCQLINVEGVRE